MVLSTSTILLMRFRHWSLIFLPKSARKLRIWATGMIVTGGLCLIVWTKVPKVLLPWPNLPPQSRFFYKVLKILGFNWERNPCRNLKPWILPGPHWLWKIQSNSTKLRLGFYRCSFEVICDGIPTVSETVGNISSIHGEGSPINSPLSTSPNNEKFDLRSSAEFNVSLKICN